MSDQKSLAKHAEALNRYAKRVQRVLDRLGSLSGVGIALEREQRVPALLSPLDKLPLRGSPEPSAEFPSGAKEARTAQAETSVFDRWQSDHTGGTEREPLLLVGSLGSGKSAILEAFALRAAATLDEWSRSPDSKPIPRIPLPVRLRALRFEQGELDHIRAFLVRSQEELAVGDSEGLLSPQVLGELLDAGNVTAFLDGFDELPGMTEFGDIRRKAITTIIRECRGSCIISSRPGYGAEALLTSARQHVVCGFGSEQVESLIRHRFGANDGKHVTKLYRNSRERVRAMMSRPLFAAAWCERVASDPPSPPSTVREVMSELYSHCFDHRRSSLPLDEKAQLHSREWLGRVLRCFVDSGRTSLTTDQLRTALTDDPLNDPDRLLSLLQVAVDTGLLRRVGRFAYSPVPSGLGEYLIAEHLVGLLSGPADGGPRFVRTFQRWVWLPECIGILELAFALMAEDSSLSPLRGSLLAWLAGVDMAVGDRVYAACVPPVSTDDLLRPFLLLAFRLALTANDTRVLTPAFAEMFVARTDNVLDFLKGRGWIESLEEARHLSGLVPDHIPSDVLNCLLHHFRDYWLRRPKTEVEFEVNPLHLCHGPLLLVDRIRTHDAAEAAEEWGRRAQSCQDAAWVWQEAARRAALRVPASHVLRELRRWQSRHGQQLPDDTASAVMCALAQQLPPTEATALIDDNLAAASSPENVMSIRLIHAAATQASQSMHFDMIARIVDAATRYGGRFRFGVWHHVLSAALSQLDPTAAGDIFTHGLAKYRASRKDFPRHAWLFVARCAAERIAPSDAVATVERVLMAITPKDAEEEPILRALLQAAAARVPPDEAGEVALRWFRYGVEAEVIEADTSDVIGLWHGVAIVAAKHASGSNNGLLINQLITELELAHPEDVQVLIEMLLGSTLHARPTEASALLARLLSFTPPTTHSMHLGLWNYALSHVAKQLPASEAYPLFEQVIDRGRIPAPDIVDCGELASAAASRLEDEEARRLILRKLEAPASLPGESVQLLRSLMTESNARGDAAYCRTLWLAGFHDEAWELAKRSGAVAVVGSRTESVNRSEVEIRDRHDHALLMDGELAHCLPVVQALASGRPWRSTHNELRTPQGAGSTSAVDHPSGTEVLHLRHREKLVLKLVADLEEQDDDPPTQLEVGAKLGLSDDIARAACVRLEKDFDLIHRPDGGRSGYRLTAAGKAILSSASNRPG